MSGPKLSAYELEQRKRAEIEHFQLKIVSMKSSALSATQKLLSQVVHLERHQQIIEASTITEEEKESAIDEIKTQISSIKELVCEYDRVAGLPSRASIEEIKADCEKIASELKVIDSKTSVCSSWQSKYTDTLKTAVDNLCNNRTAPPFSIEDALAELRPSQDDNKRIEKTTDITKKREILLKRANKLLKSFGLCEQDRNRIQDAICRINETNTPRELDEIASLVLGEIERSVKQFSSLLSDFQQLTNTKEILASSLGLTYEEPSAPESVTELNSATTLLKQQIKQMEEALLARAERKEIALCIDEAMRELGYELIGSKRKGSRNSIFTLYNFHGKTGLQVVQREDGVVRIQVVGLSNGTHTVSDDEEDFLFHEQELFCEDYEKIVRAFESKGIRGKKGSVYRNPPDRQFNTYVNVHEYDPLYRIYGQSVSTTDMQGKKKQQHKPPKIISKP